MAKGKELTTKKAQEIMQVEITGADIKQYFCPHATEKEVFMALGVIKSLNLNPHTREVHLVKYSKNDKLSIIVGYEVFLKRAERSGKLAGWEAGTTDDNKKTWVKIWRKDWGDRPFYWEVVLAEFDKKQSTWKQIPSFMGKKVAIAQGFRLCFPDELGGMPYTQEEHDVYDIDSKAVKTKPDVEMPEAIEDAEVEKNERLKKEEPLKESKPQEDGVDETDPEEITEPDPNAPPIDKEQIKNIHVLAGKLWGKKFEEPYKEKLYTWTGKDTSKALSFDEAKAVIAMLSTELTKKFNDKKGKK